MYKRQVYIQGVLQGYRIGKGGSKRNVTERCYTYRQMSNTRNTRRVNGSTWYGIGWPASCNEGWRARYDIAVEYKKVEAQMCIRDSDYTSLMQEVVDYAMQFLGNPYVWGGEKMCIRDRYKAASVGYGKIARDRD